MKAIMVQWSSAIHNDGQILGLSETLGHGGQQSQVRPCPGGDSVILR